MVHLILLAVACVVGLVGFNFLTQATLGIGLIAMGCFCGILARVIQAERHFRAQSEQSNIIPNQRGAAQAHLEDLGDAGGRFKAS